MRTWTVKVNGADAGQLAARDAGVAINAWLAGNTAGLEAGPAAGDLGGPYGSRRKVRFTEGEWWAELNLGFKGGDSGVHGWVIGDTFGIGGIDDPGGWYAGSYVDEDGYPIEEEEEYEEAA